MHNRAANRVGEIATARNGMHMEIIAYKNNKNLRVRFEDGYETDTQYTYFLRGLVKNPNVSKIHTSLPESTARYYLEPLGFQKLPGGYWKRYNPEFGTLELDLFHILLKCGVEYDGLFWHSKPNVIKRDKLKNKLCQESDIYLLRIRENGLPELGNSIMRSNIHSLISMEPVLQELIAHINKACGTNFIVDVNIKRDYDAILQYHLQCTMQTSVTAFSKLCPQEDEIRAVEQAARTHAHVGEVQTFKDGTSGTLVAYYHCNHVLIQLDNGKIYQSTYKNFHRRHKPSYNQNAINQSRQGQTNTAVNQRQMTIVQYYNRSNCTIQWDDGTQQTRVQYGSFLSGHVAYHPDVTTDTR